MHVGHVEAKKLYLYPEEALQLMDQVRHFTHITHVLKLVQDDIYVEQYHNFILGTMVVSYSPVFRIHTQIKDPSRTECPHDPPMTTTETPGPFLV